MFVYCVDFVTPSSARRPAGTPRWPGGHSVRSAASALDRNLDDTIALVLEKIIGFFDAMKRIRVCDQRFGIDLAVGDQRQAYDDCYYAYTNDLLLFKR